MYIDWRKCNILSTKLITRPDKSKDVSEIVFLRSCARARGVGPPRSPNEQLFPHDTTLKYNQKRFIMFKNITYTSLPQDLEALACEIRRMQRAVRDMIIHNG
jgi:hypothetical protein